MVNYIALTSLILGIIIAVTSSIIIGYGLEFTGGVLFGAGLVKLCD